MSIFVENSILPLRIAVFDTFLTINLSENWSFLGHFWGHFRGGKGGYPSPSISAPLVVKKCLKLYIYNIGGQPPL